ncbi:hypothetical protein FDF77_17260 [Clostridium sporogenes]|nr:hypothetical protein [Clostridium sporogenes]NFQ60566.1 hypothetical protein [Clostridium sporogenes]NFU11127.1 hypothetical protein [Clostridium sporogenes]NFU43923.1 hypothetical protein [Clostridium sporogenes]NFU62713.1 hypothetical protein [Clostridium sporogenes]
MSKIINKIKRRVLSMFSFNKESGCVKVWVTLIMGGTYTFEQVPKLLNLQECVKEVLIEMGAIEKDKEKEDIVQ